MLKFKKMVSVIVGICIISSMLNLTLTASSPLPNYAGGDDIKFEPLELQRDRILSNPNLTAEQRAKAVEHYYSAVQSMNAVTSKLRPTRALLTAKKLDVPFYEQETYYYCGPATTQQTFFYLNVTLNGARSAPAQSYIATKLGTTESNGTNLDDMKNYLNDSFNIDYFVQWWWASADTMSDSIYQAIHDDERPTILHIVISNIANTGWKFPTNGHFVNVVGYNSSCTEFDIVDPYKDGHGISDGAYTVTADDIFTYHIRMMY